MGVSQSTNISDMLAEMSTNILVSTNVNETSSNELEQTVDINDCDITIIGSGTTFGSTSDQVNSASQLGNVSNDTSLSSDIAQSLIQSATSTTSGWGIGIADSINSSTVTSSITSTVTTTSTENISAINSDSQSFSCESGSITIVGDDTTLGNTASQLLGGSQATDVTTYTDIVSSIDDSTDQTATATVEGISFSIVVIIAVLIAALILVAILRPRRQSNVITKGKEILNLMTDSFLYMGVAVGLLVMGAINLSTQIPCNADSQCTNVGTYNVDMGCSCTNHVTCGLEVASKTPIEGVGTPLMWLSNLEDTSTGSNIIPYEIRPMAVRAFCGYSSSDPLANNSGYNVQIYLNMREAVMGSTTSNETTTSTIFAGLLQFFQRKLISYQDFSSSSDDVGIIDPSTFNSTSSTDYVAPCSSELCNLLLPIMPYYFPQTSVSTVDEVTTAEVTVISAIKLKKQTRQKIKNMRPIPKKSNFLSSFKKVLKKFKSSKPSKKRLAQSNVLASSVNLGQSLCFKENDDGTVIYKRYDPTTGCGSYTEMWRANDKGGGALMCKNEEGNVNIHLTTGTDYASLDCDDGYEKEYLHIRGSIGGDNDEDVYQSFETEGQLPGPHMAIRGEGWVRTDEGAGYTTDCGNYSTYTMPEYMAYNIEGTAINEVSDLLWQSEGSRGLFSFTDGSADVGGSHARCNNVQANYGQTIIYDPLGRYEDNDEVSDAYDPSNTLSLRMGELSTDCTGVNVSSLCQTLNGSDKSDQRPRFVAEVYDGGQFADEDFSLGTDVDLIYDNSTIYSKTSLPDGVGLLPGDAFCRAATGFTREVSQMNTFTRTISEDLNSGDFIYTGEPFAGNLAVDSDGIPTIRNGPLPPIGSCRAYYNDSSTSDSTDDSTDDTADESTDDTAVESTIPVRVCSVVAPQNCWNPELCSIMGGQWVMADGSISPCDGEIMLGYNAETWEFTDCYHTTSSSPGGMCLSADEICSSSNCVACDDDSCDEIDGCETLNGTCVASCNPGEGICDSCTESECTNPCSFIDSTCRYGPDECADDMCSSTSTETLYYLVEIPEVFSSSGGGTGVDNCMPSVFEPNPTGSTAFNPYDESSGADNCSSTGTSFSSEIAHSVNCSLEASQCYNQINSEDDESGNNGFKLLAVPNSVECFFSTTSTVHNSGSSTNAYNYTAVPTTEYQSFAASNDSNEQGLNMWYIINRIFMWVLILSQTAGGQSYMTTSLGLSTVLNDQGMLDGSPVLPLNSLDDLEQHLDTNSWFKIQPLLFITDDNTYLFGTLYDVYKVYTNQDTTSTFATQFKNSYFNQLNMFVYDGSTNVDGVSFPSTSLFCKEGVASGYTPSSDVQEDLAIMNSFSGTLIGSTGTCQSLWNNKYLNYGAIAVSGLIVLGLVAAWIKQLKS